MRDKINFAIKQLEQLGKSNRNLRWLKQIGSPLST